MIHIGYIRYMVGKWVPNDAAILCTPTDEITVCTRAYGLSLPLQTEYIVGFQITPGVTQVAHIDVEPVPDEVDPYVDPLDIMLESEMSGLDIIDEPFAAFEIVAVPDDVCNASPSPCPFEQFPVTDAEMAALEAEAYYADRFEAEREAYQTGREEGYEAGLAFTTLSAREGGYAAGRKDGYEAGRNDGFEAGRDAGVEDACAAAQAGRENGYDNGWEDGYRAGLKDGRHDVPAHTRQAFDDGYSEGRDAGWEQASEAARKETDRMLRLVSAVFEGRG